MRDWCRYLQDYKPAKKKDKDFEKNKSINHSFIDILSKKQ